MPAPVTAGDPTWESYSGMGPGLLGGRALRRFAPGGPYLLIVNMGDGTGILWKRSLVWRGRLALRLKEFIDRRFMGHYQVSGELLEPLAESE